jgi:hypothetical protein
MSVSEYIPPLDPEETRRRRRAQLGTACFPCRQRKVKCSYETPCDKCIERGHQQLCVYEPLSKRGNLRRSSQDKNATTASEPQTINFEWETLQGRIDRLEQVILELRHDVKEMALSSRQELEHGDVKKVHSAHCDGSERHSVPMGIHTNNNLVGETVYLGGNSVPAMVVALTEGHDESIQELAGKSILPIFALDNESTSYPFVDLWGLPHGSGTRVRELSKLLPRDTECLEVFRHYRDTAHVLFPGIIEIEQFEWELTEFLTERNNTAGITPDYDGLPEQKIYGQSLHWIGLLFAALASGCQCLNRIRRERQLTSQVYGKCIELYRVLTLRILIYTVVCCSYECLRTVNYLSHSSPTDIQTLLVLGNVLSNSMNAGVAWSFLGLLRSLIQRRMAYNVRPHHSLGSSTWTRP